MVRLENKDHPAYSAMDEYINPLPQKVLDDRLIYLSRNEYGPLETPIAGIEIVDFGHSVLGDASNSGCIQAEPYRAPEVIVDAGYNYGADIWSLGVMV